MTKRFLKDDIHELMMKTSTDYAISEKYGLHDTLDALEGVVKNRNSPNSNSPYRGDYFIRMEIERKREYLKSHYGQIYGRMDDSEIEREYNRRERQESENNFLLYLEKLREKNEENERKKKIREEADKKDREYLEGLGYDTSQMNRLEVKISAGARCLERKGYDISKMGPFDVALKGIEERRKERLSEDLAGRLKLELEKVLAKPL